MEAIGYVLLYFYKGILPWQNLPAANKKEKYEKIMEMKIKTSINSLCHGCPREFMDYLRYAKNMQFEDRPDYAYLKGLFTTLFEKEGFQMDENYDWVLKRTF